MVVVELEIAILDNNMNIEGTSVAVDENQDYSNPIDCGVSPDVTKLQCSRDVATGPVGLVSTGALFNICTFANGRLTLTSGRRYS